MLQLITLQMGQYYIGLDLKKVVKVIAAQSILQLHEKSAFVEGLIDFQGEIIAVINMYQRLNIVSKNEISLTDKFIVLETGIRKIAFRVDDVLNVITVDAVDAENNVQVCPGARFVSMLKANEKLIYIYDSETLLSTTELIDIENIIHLNHSNYVV